MKGAPAIGVAVGVAFALVIACARPIQAPQGPKRDEILALWTQIRTFRHDAHMPLDPAQQTVMAFIDKPVQEAERVCPAGRSIPPKCNDVCDLAGAICDNAESICRISNELGTEDTWAQDKCASAKGSCREAQQKCCNCHEDPP